VSKLEAGKVDLETIDFDLVETVENAVTLLAPKAHGKGIDLGVYIDAAARASFRGDPTRLRQILLNLVGNGLKFTDKGMVLVEVSVALAPSAGTAILRFDVKDTGIGMPEQVRLGLFEKFNQADSSITRRYGGTGLGLAISKQLVELMGGRIGVESRPGLGSKFWFELPLAVSTAQPAPRETQLAQLQGVRALAVDDIEMNLEIISRQLRGFGMEVTCSRDGFDAIAEMERAWHRGKPYDIVFLDQMMPGMAGDGLSARIRANPSLAEAKLVLVSSAGPQARTGAGAKAMNAILEKPLRQRDLLNCLAMLYAAPLKSLPDGDAAARAAAGPVRPLFILLAEDNKINQKFAVALLGRAGHRVDVAENGHQAVDAVRHADYDVVLMDIQMPELDGVQATKQIRALAPPKCEVPIIALTAHAMSGAKEQYLEAGMNDYVSKPIDPNVLLAKLAGIALSTEPRMPAIADRKAEREDRPAGEQPAIDPVRLETLKSVMSPEEVHEFIDLYLGQTDERLARIEAFMDSADLEKTAREAHAMIGGAGNVGAMRVCDLARSLEEACKAGDRMSAVHHAKSLDEASRLASAELRGSIAKRTPVPAAA
jgi:CheY-like chemotaxis protein/HPt (histidine-containing phosphotransfer) domain-containing protein